ncbi:MAG: glycosyltransferase [Clostridia bacterium]|nr:glycosyltransferase [Clostridia bacterium]
MKKILIFAPTAPTSGITQYILNILNTAALDGLEIDILSFKNDRLKKWAEEKGRKYYEFNISMYKHPIKYRRFLNEVFSSGYNVVHYHLSSLSTLNIFKIARKSGVKKIILHSHSTFTDLPSKMRTVVFSTIHKLLRKRATGFADVLCACSKPAAEWMFGSHKAQEAFILNNAVDTDKFAYNKDVGCDIKAQLGIKEKYVIGHIGRFSKQKNQHFLIEIMEEVLKLRDDCALVLVGDGADREYVQEFSKEKRLDNKIWFVDFKEDIYKYYSSFDLFVLSSLFEGLPITLVEAQANGLHSLVSDNITKESNLTGLVEFLPLEEGSAFWAQKLCKALDSSKRIETKMLLKEKGFDLAEQSEKLLRLYRG